VHVNGYVGEFDRGAPLPHLCWTAWCHGSTSTLCVGIRRARRPGVVTPATTVWCLMGVGLTIWQIDTATTQLDYRQPVCIQTMDDRARHAHRAIRSKIYRDLGEGH
jgi:hypothetical protein